MQSTSSATKLELIKAEEDIQNLKREQQDKQRDWSTAEAKLKQQAETLRLVGEAAKQRASVSNLISTSPIRVACM